MPHRSASPTLSELGFDISTALLPNDSASLKSAAGSKKDGDLAAATSNSQGEVLEFSDDDDDDDENDDEAYIAAQQAASNRKATNVKGKSVKKGGAFQAMGLNSLLLKSITRKGFSVPTPIQRKSIPLILDNRDLVGMARTGSGKTAAFVIPMIQRLKAHSVKVGSRAIVLSPSRELALQTLKTIKEFGKGTDLRSVLLVGGDSLEDQFAQMASNPDIIIATPGRFMHLLVEMSLDMSSVRYVVFDEADRLFEMGFATQLHEILHALPPSRQTLLFSATLPSSLVEFAKAGLKDPELVRLDTESKISPDLQSAFLAVKSAEREGALMHILQDVIQMPVGHTPSQPSGGPKPMKRKRNSTQVASQELPTEHSTIIFAATKHHVEYLAQLLGAAGYAVSYVYGSLDQTARKMQVEAFRKGLTQILVVTDVAARGIDIPLLANVINFNFPPQPKIFIHRVGRTARAGRTGWSYSLVQESDLPYLLDLQLFLSRRLVTGRDENASVNFATDIILGGIPQRQLETGCESADKLLEDADLAALKDVAAKGEKLYSRTRSAASSESVKRARTISTENLKNQPNLLYEDDDATKAKERDDMLARISNFRPVETVFEIGKRGSAAEAAETMRRKKVKLNANKNVSQELSTNATEADQASLTVASPAETNLEAEDLAAFHQDEINESEEDDVEVAFQGSGMNGHNRGENVWADSEHFMTYQPRTADLNEEKGYGVNSGSNFAGAAREVSMSLVNDESRAHAEPSRVRWDKRSKKYVSRSNDTDGSKGAKTIKGESGQKLAATFKSGRYDAWKRANRMDRMPRTGEVETPRNSAMPSTHRKFKHFAERAPKQPDKYRDDYYKKKKKITETKANDPTLTTRAKAKNELRAVDDVRKQRDLKTRRKEKNARPSRKKRKT